MPHDPQDTIAAIASPAGAAARGIVRLSGPRAIDCVEQVWHSLPDGSQSLAALRRPMMVAGELRLDGFDSAVPSDLYVWPGARSYTRQLSVEIHTIGSPPILQGVLRTVCRCGARMAGPGEFTLRAFLAGRLDLTQAEAVLGVIDARDRRQLDIALAQLAGGLAGPLHQLRGDLLDLLAHLEAGLDFVEDDIEFVSRDQIEREVSSALVQVQGLVERTTARAVLGEAVRVVLVGRPNVGKSSLFNRLLGESAALVSSAAGTTRDYLTGELTIADIRLELVDTAGFFPDTEPGNSALDPPPDVGIEAAGRRAALRARSQADIELLCLDATRPLQTWERAQIRAASAEQQIVALMKTDQARAIEPIAGAVPTSSATGQGLDELRDRLRAAAVARRGEAGGVVLATAARCHESLRGAAQALAAAHALVTQRAGEELVAAELRAALDDLGQVVGAVYTEDLLDRIFSRFCIGK